MMLLEDNRSRRSEVVCYSETDDEEFDSNDVVECIISETINNATRNEELNKKKQFKKALKKGKQDNWNVEESRSLAKGKRQTDRYFFYVNFHPGVYRTLVPVIAQYMDQYFGITLKSGKPDKFGEVIIKNITYFDFVGDGMEKSLMINFYPTSSALDVRLKGSITDSSIKFADKGGKTAAAYFVQDILPQLMLKLEENHDLEKAKSYWMKLAKEGYNHEKNKDIQNTRPKRNKCDHCNKIVGKKTTLDCGNCCRTILTECLTDVNEKRIMEFTSSKELFLCDKCVPKVNVETLSIDVDNHETNTSNPKEIENLGQTQNLEDDSSKFNQLKSDLEAKQKELEESKEKYSNRVSDGFY